MFRRAKSTKPKARRDPAFQLARGAMCALGSQPVPDDASKQNLDNQIAVARRNIADLMERAAAAHGSAAEEAIANRINEQQELLNQLLKQREAMD